MGWVSLIGYHDCGEAKVCIVMIHKQTLCQFHKINDFNNIALAVPVWNFGEKILIEKTGRNSTGVLLMVLITKTDSAVSVNSPCAEYVSV